MGRQSTRRLLQVNSNPVSKQLIHLHQQRQIAFNRIFLVQKRLLTVGVAG
jgi:hypothetical protein